MEKSQVNPQKKPQLSLRRPGAASSNEESPPSSSGMGSSGSIDAILSKTRHSKDVSEEKVRTELDGQNKSLQAKELQLDERELKLQETQSSIEDGERTLRENEALLAAREMNLRETQALLTAREKLLESTQSDMQAEGKMEEGKQQGEWSCSHGEGERGRRDPGGRAGLLERQHEPHHPQYLRVRVECALLNQQWTPGVEQELVGAQASTQEEERHGLSDEE